LGVACYQWALEQQKTGGIMAIAALTPPAVIPFAWWLGGERPSARSFSGGLMAVAGTIWLTFR
jgi:drug/metabolite transporter (DMT)-like permease